MVQSVLLLSAYPRLLCIYVYILSASAPPRLVRDGACRRILPRWFRVSFRSPLADVVYIYMHLVSCLTCRGGSALVRVGLLCRGASECPSFHRTDVIIVCSRAVVSPCNAWLLASGPIGSFLLRWFRVSFRRVVLSPIHHCLQRFIKK